MYTVYTPLDVLPSALMSAQSRGTDFELWQSAANTHTLSQSSCVLLYFLVDLYNLN